MAVPTYKFRTFPNTIAATALNTAAKRIAAIAGESLISTGVGNELDYGTIDISGGAADSAVKHTLWNVTADGGNTLVETFKVWLSANGLDQAGSVFYLQPISGSDQVSPSDTENYVQNAVVESYTFAEMPEAEPDANIYPTDEGSSMVLSTTSDDALLWASYIHIASGETTGTYRGTTTGFESQTTLKFSYS